jgi:hypothetical protein
MKKCRTIWFFVGGFSFFSAGLIMWNNKYLYKKKSIKIGVLFISTCSLYRELFLFCFFLMFVCLILKISPSSCFNYNIHYCYYNVRVTKTNQAKSSNTEFDDERKWLCCMMGFNTHFPPFFHSNFSARSVRPLFISFSNFTFQNN